MSNIQAINIPAEDVLPLELVREHTRTDDVTSVSDAQLVLYRRAALEAAEMYTNRLLTTRKIITENVTHPPARYRERDSLLFTYTTKSAFSENVAYWYGSGISPMTELFVDIGSTTVRLPCGSDDFGLGCCNPCREDNSIGRLMYVAGYSCAEDIPAALALGALKYIAHIVGNAGDKSQNVGTFGAPYRAISVNPALDSGALDIWNSIRVEP